MTTVITHKREIQEKDAVEISHMVSYNAKNKPKNSYETKELENLVPIVRFLDPSKVDCLT